jgi:hypothetical protein
MARDLRLREVFSLLVDTDHCDFGAMTRYK